MTTHRIMPKTNKSFFLFGPRATGKSTWLKKQMNLDALLETKKISRAYGVYTGKEILKSDQIFVYPIEKFIELIF